MRGGIKSIYTPIYDVSLYELLKTYANINAQKSFQRVNIPKLPVLTTEQGINNIKNQLDNLNDWKNIVDLIPENYKQNISKKKNWFIRNICSLFRTYKRRYYQYNAKKNF